MKKINKPLTNFIIVNLLLLFSLNSMSQVAPVNIPSGGFNINGHVKVNSAAGDWTVGTDAGATGGYVLEQSLVSPFPWQGVNTSTTKIIRDAYDNSADLIFTGSSFGDNPNTWKWTTGKATNKCDINNALFHSTTSATQKWLVLGGDRFTTTGTSYIDFQFSQGIFTRTSTGFSSVGPNGESLAGYGGRTPGDFVLSMEYTNGGAVATVHYYRWQATSEGGSYKFVDLGVPAGAIGASNTAAVDVPYGAFGSTSYIAFAFVEAAVNIDAILSGTCQSINIKSIFVSTKASDSYNAALKDFVDPQEVNFTFGQAGLSYPQTSYCASATATPNIPSSPNGTFTSSPSLGANLNSTTGVISLAGVTPGTYTITYTPDASSGACLTPSNFQLTINAIPAITPGTNPVVCRGATSASLSYSGATGSPTKYSINFDATAEGQLFADVTDANLPASPISIVVPANAVAGTYNGVLSVKTAAGCVSSNYNITVTVNANPTVSVNSPVKCANDAAVSITATPDPAAGGGVSYNYSWSTRPGGVADPGNVPGFSASVGGTYGVVITRVGTGCTGSGSGSLTVNSNPTVTVNSPTKCSGDADVTITATPNPAVGAGISYNYSWSTRPAGVADPGNVASFSASVAGTYGVVITRVGTNCTGSGSGTLSVNENPAIPSVCVVQPSLCGPSTGKVSFTDLGAGYTYSIKNGAAGQWHSCPVFLTVAAGDVTGLKVKSPAGCVSAAANCNTICQTDPVACAGGDVISRTAPQQMTIEDGSQLRVKAYPNPFSDKVKFVVSVPVEGEGVLDLYNMMGQRIKNIYTGHFKAGTQNFELSLPGNQVATLVYVLRVAGKQVTGKLVQTN